MSIRPITEDDLNAYVDDALDPARRTEVAAYLAAHPDIARRVAGHVRQRAELRELLAPAAEEPVPPELDLARLIEARRRPRLDGWRAAAAVVLLSVGAAGGWLARGPAQPVSGIEALAQEAADSYAVYAPDRTRPVEIRAADQASLVAWASQRLQRKVAVPDLVAAGYRFMGGRVLATSHGPAVMFMYDDDHGSRLVVLSRPMAREGDTRMVAHERGAIAGFSWVGDGLGYSLVGKLPPAVLHPIADDVRRQVAASI